MADPTKVSMRVFPNGNWGPGLRLRGARSRARCHPGTSPRTRLDRQFRGARRSLHRARRHSSGFEAREKMRVGRQRHLAGIRHSVSRLAGACDPIERDSVLPLCAEKFEGAAVPRGAIEQITVRRETRIPDGPATEGDAMQSGLAPCAGCSQVNAARAPRAETTAPMAAGLRAFCVLPERRPWRERKFRRAFRGRMRCLAPIESAGPAAFPCSGARCDREPAQS